MSSYRVVPLTDWSGFGEVERRRSPFGAAWLKTERQLDGEIGHLQNGHTRNWAEFVLELDVLAGAIRKDGGLYANAKVNSPAVRVSFDTIEHGPLSYACDRFTTWQDNVRAIALGLEALRKVDRYGIGQGAQYAGYAQLGAGSGDAASHMTRDAAIEVLGQYVPDGWDADNPRDLASMFRAARGKTHPDRNGGDRGPWDLVEQAAAVLGLS